MLGTHLYADAGVRDLAVTDRLKGRAVRTSTSEPGPASADGTVRYRVSLDTQALQGSAATLALQFNAAVATGSPDAQLFVRNLRGAQSLDGAPGFAGAASGDLLTEAVLRPSDVLNRLQLAMTLGARLEFDVELRGAALSRPAGGRVAAALAVQLLGADASTPLLAGAATVIRVDLLPCPTVAHVPPPPRGRGCWPALGRGHGAAAGDAAAQPGRAVFRCDTGPTAQRHHRHLHQHRPGPGGGRLQRADRLGRRQPGQRGQRHRVGGPFLDRRREWSSRRRGSYRPRAAQPSDADGSAVIERSPQGGQGQLEASPMGPLITVQAPTMFADVNGDGWLDLAAMSFPLGDRVRCGRASARFRLRRGDRVADDAGLRAPARGDFNGDGFADIVVAGQNDSQARSLRVLLGDGSGQFAGGLVSQPAGAHPSTFASADFDEDGNLDLLVGTGFSGGANLPGRLIVLRGRGDGSFDDAVTLTVSGGNVTPVVADMNLDGHADVVVGTRLQYAFGASAARRRTGVTRVFRPTSRSSVCRASPSPT